MILQWHSPSRLTAKNIWTAMLNFATVNFGIFKYYGLGNYAFIR